MKDCEICPYLVGQLIDDENVLMQTDRWVSVLDPNQSYLGKSYVTLREHKETISDLDAVDWAELHIVMASLEGAIKRAFGASVANWECLMNNAVMANQPTHVHWHLYPRYLGGTSFRGVEFPDEKWPRHLEGVKRPVNQELFAEIAGKIREDLRGN